MNFDFTKMVEARAFLMKPKHYCDLSQRGESVYGTQSWKERWLLPVRIFIPSNEQTLIQRKVVGIKAFLMKPMHHSHLCQWGECVYET